MAEILGNFEQAVLLAILRLGEEAYGRAILKEVEARLERDVVAGAVHATLERLTERGLVVSQLDPRTPVRGGRARRFYRLQAKGLRALNDARATVESLWHGLRWPLKGSLRLEKRKSPPFRKKARKGRAMRLL
jgi:DNA-binding PadR family transcriptional regulator